MKIDYTFIHNEAITFNRYMGNFLKESAPENQIFEELKRLLARVADNEAERKASQQAIQAGRAEAMPVCKCVGNFKNGCLLHGGGWKISPAP